MSGQSYVSPSVPAASSMLGMGSGRFNSNGFGLTNGPDAIGSNPNFMSPSTFSNTTPTEFGLQPNKSVPYHYSCKSADETRLLKLTSNVSDVFPKVLKLSSEVSECKPLPLAPVCPRGDLRRRTSITVIGGRRMRCRCRARAAGSAGCGVHGASPVSGYEPLAVPRNDATAVASVCRV